MSQLLQLSSNIKPMIAQVLFCNRILFFALLLGSLSVQAADHYDATTNRLTIPRVVLGASEYQDVVLTVGSVLSVGGVEGVYSSKSSISVDTYNPNTSVLFIPAVKAYETTYLDVEITVSDVISIGNTVLNEIGPISAKPSSYENAKASNIKPIRSPQYATALGLADFEQNGKHSLVLGEYNSENDENGVTSKFGKFKFYSQKNENAPWVDITQKMLDDDTGCIHARKAVVADFNGDGKPDVFFACHGIDFIPDALRNQYEGGERPRMLLSQSNGRYKNVLMDFHCYCHGASAAELNSKGYADLVVTDTMTENRPFLLLNNKDGTFTKKLTATPNELLQNPRGSGFNIYTTELIDFNGDGKFDWFMAGGKSGDDLDFTPTIFFNDGTDNFSFVTSQKLPEPTLSRYVTLDIIQKGSRIALLHTSDYKDYYLQIVDLMTNESSTTPLQGGGWFWILLLNRNIVSLDSTLISAVSF